MLVKQTSVLITNTNQSTVDKRDKRIPELCWNTGVVSRSLLGGWRRRGIEKESLVLLLLCETPTGMEKPIFLMWLLRAPKGSERRWKDWLALWGLLSAPLSSWEETVVSPTSAPSST